MSAGRVARGPGQSGGPRAAGFGRTCVLALCLGVAPAAAAVVGDPADAPPDDPTKAEVPLPAADGWQASLIIDNGDTGIWTAGALQAMPRFGCPEVFGLDDRGRCLLLSSYSGKWTPYTTIEDGAWLGALAQVDLDPRVDGPELYTGGKLGNLYQIVTHHRGGLDTALIARFPGEEIHALASGELLPSRPGDELVLFTRLGETWLIERDADGAWTPRMIADLRTRVRQAVVLPCHDGRRPWIAAVCRDGGVRLLRLTEQGGVEQRQILREPMGFGRCALRPGRGADDEQVLYVTRDDGVVLRLAGRPEVAGAWAREMVYAGPQGLRGVAAGRFDPDPSVETLAVFGYSAKVQLLSRPEGGSWSARTLFVDRDKGHWLATAELDGRNNTDELIASGYGGRMLLLARVPGTGLEGVLTDPDPPERPRLAPPGASQGADDDADDDAPDERTARVTVAIAADPEAARQLDTLRYAGGFESKTLVFETLVRRGPDGALAPGLASSWTLEEDGRVVVLRLRDGARWHDGDPVDAASVVQHLRRWVGLPEHAWLRSSERITRWEVRSPRELAVHLSEPWALLPELCAVNPCGVRGPGTLDAAGEFVAPVGSGPFRVAGVGSDGRLHLTAVTDDCAVDLRCYGGEQPGDPFEDLLAGRVDLLVDGWKQVVPRDRLDALAGSSRWALADGPGSSVVYLSFNLAEGPTADTGLRRAVRSALDRRALIEAAEGGWADACLTWAAPCVDWWPAAFPPPLTAEVSSPVRALRLVVTAGDAVLADALATQLAGVGLPTVVELLDADGLDAALDAGAFDLRIERTWGLPYDPYLSLTARFLPATAAPSAATLRSDGVDPELGALAARIARTPDEAGRRDLYARFQARLDLAASIVPLYAPRRLALYRADLPAPRLDGDLYHLDLSAYCEAPRPG